MTTKTVFVIRHWGTDKLASYWAYVTHEEAGKAAELLIQQDDNLSLAIDELKIQETK